MSGTAPLQGPDENQVGLILALIAQLRLRDSSKRVDCDSLPARVSLPLTHGDAGVQELKDEIHASITAVPCVSTTLEASGGIRLAPRAFMRTESKD
jgi:hypothetical protein